MSTLSIISTAQLRVELLRLQENGHDPATLAAVAKAFGIPTDTSSVKRVGIILPPPQISVSWRAARSLEKLLANRDQPGGEQ